MSEEHEKNAPLPNYPEQEIYQEPKFEKELNALMLADRDKYVNGVVMSMEDLIAKWLHKFETRRAFFSYFGLIDPIYEESVREENNREYPESLVAHYGVDSTAEKIALENFSLDKKNKIRIKSALIPLAEIGLGNVESEWIDLSMDLLKKLNPNNLGHRLLLKSIISSLHDWEQATGNRIRKDGILMK